MKVNKPEHAETAATPDREAHPVVGIGFSAGGLEAFKDFLAGIDPETRASYVVIQHIAVDYRSQLLKIIASNAPLKVQHLEDRHSIEPATIYVLKEDSEVRIADDHFVLSSPSKKTARRSSIDLFFASLAEAKADHAVGVVLVRKQTGNDFSDYRRNSILRRIRRRMSLSEIGELGE